VLGSDTCERVKILIKLAGAISGAIMSVVTAFNTLLDQFMTELSRLFPADIQLRTYHTFANGMAAVQPSSLLKYFRATVLPYKSQIEARDAQFFLRKDYTEEMAAHGTDVIESMRLKELWCSMSDQSKRITFDYLQKLVSLAELHT
jgi:hypothetical protein